MAIQQGINQLLGMAGTMAMLSPQLRAKAETRAKIAGLERQAETVAKARESTPNLTEKLEYQEELADIKKQIFETKPSETTYSAYRKERPIKSTTAVEADPEEIAMERAEAIMKEQEIEQLTQQLITPYSPKEALRKMQKKGTDQIKQKHMFQSLIDSLSEAERSGYNGK